MKKIKSNNLYLPTHDFESHKSQPGSDQQNEIIENETVNKLDKNASTVEHFGNNDSKSSENENLHNDDKELEGKKKGESCSSFRAERIPAGFKFVLAEHAESYRVTVV